MSRFLRAVCAAAILSTIGAGHALAQGVQFFPPVGACVGDMLGTNTYVLTWRGGQSAVQCKQVPTACGAGEIIAFDPVTADFACVGVASTVKLDLVNAGGPTGSATCTQMVANMNAASGVSGGYVSQGAGVVKSSTGAWYFMTDHTGDCSPMSNTTRAVGFIARDKNGNAVNGYFQ